MDRIDRIPIENDNILFILLILFKSIVATI